MAVVIPKKIYQLITDLQNLMSGYNYEVTMGINIYPHCHSLDDFKFYFKRTFPKSNPEVVTFIPMTLDDFWEDIDFGFNHRGDKKAGYSLELNKNQEEKLKNKQEDYKKCLTQLMMDQLKIYSYPDENGIPAIPFIGIIDM